ncbi:phage tail protein I [Bosea sp. (in: a-proteobacteria)]|uniref:phage tail protein I n=1 Tax=Bosea sp. (in: a-proteobacteria) TaxID=1871050 RepID=UPI001ACBF3E9|nr:phage tail protein I [Bosea sp. (in: a-proteobacteria)]MBN9443686.1 phage tail protein I [Bosea sp. (in: a-proteobacteria)]
MLIPPLEGAASPGERALLHAMTDALPVPVREAVSPPETPTSFLPFLAVHNGVRLWFGDWSEDRKREIVGEWAELADIIGTRAALQRLLAYVDAQLISSVAHPRRFVLGQSALGIQPIQFPAFTARYLIKVGLRRHKASLVLGRGAFGLHALVPVSREPIRRAKIAASVSKGPATQYTATFAHRRQPSFDEMEFDMPFDAFIDRTSL